MPIATSDGQLFDSQFDLLSNQPVGSNSYHTANAGIDASLPADKDVSYKNSDKPFDKSYVPLEDYDYAAAKAAGVTPDARGHLPDTFKRPNHITFSTESIFNDKDNQGGKWAQSEDGKWSFEPGPTNLKYHTSEELKQYFKKYEPDATLLLPDDPDMSGTTQGAPEADPALAKFYAAAGKVLSAPFVNFAKVAHKASQGQFDEDEAIKASTDLAGTLMEGGLATAPMREGIGLFGGRMSQSAVDFAERLEARGWKPENIKFTTGLERGAEGMWRKELNDSESKFFPEKLKYNPEIGDKYAENLDDVLHHPKFFDAYPEARDVAVSVVPEIDKNPNVRGMFDPSSNIVYLKDGLSADQQHSTLLHELQHYIQYHEGFHFGVPEMVPSDLQDQVRGYRLRNYAQDSLEKLADHIDAGNYDAARGIAKDLLARTEGSVYKSLSSEVEARNVQARMKQSPTASRTSLGSSTEDVPRGEQIVPLGERIYAGSAYDKGLGEMETR